MLSQLITLGCRRTVVVVDNYPTKYEPTTTGIINLQQQKHVHWAQRFEYTRYSVYAHHIIHLSNNAKATFGNAIIANQWNGAIPF